MEHRPSLSCSPALSTGEPRQLSEAVSTVRLLSSYFCWSFLSRGCSDLLDILTFRTSSWIVLQASGYALKGILKGATHAHKTGISGYSVSTANLVLWLGPSCGQEDVAAAHRRNLSLAGFDDVITREGFLRRMGLVPSLFGEEG